MLFDGINFDDLSDDDFDMKQANLLDVLKVVNSQLKVNYPETIKIVIEMYADFNEDAPNMKVDVQANTGKEMHLAFIMACMRDPSFYMMMATALMSHEITVLYNELEGKKHGGIPSQKMKDHINTVMRIMEIRRKNFDRFQNTETISIHKN